MTKIPQNISLKRLNNPDKEPKSDMKLSADVDTTNGENDKSIIPNVDKLYDTYWVDNLSVYHIKKGEVISILNDRKYVSITVNRMDGGDIDFLVKPEIKQIDSITFNKIYKSVLNKLINRL